MLSRRKFFEKSGQTAATLTLFNSVVPKATALTEDPHFFLQVFIKGGLDASYLFDTRDVLFTGKGKIQNYRSDKSIYNWQDSRGGNTWVSSLAKPLEAYKNDFSILNGVHMARGFDGHPQNIAMMVTGSATGGKLFVTDFPKPASTPLHFVAQGRFEGFETPSMEMGVSLRPDVARRLAERFKGVAPVSDQSRIWNFIKSRSAAAGTGGSGSFSRGAGQLFSGMTGSSDIIAKQHQIQLCKEDPNVPCDPQYRIENTDTSVMSDSLKTAFEYFTKGLAGSALVSVRYELDTHDKGQAQAQDVEVKKVADDLKLLLDFLKKPYDSSRGISFGDVTTVIVSSEFSRTMRQIDQTIEETGTDHNPFTNTVMVAGKGFKKGLVVGATDLDALDAAGEFSGVSVAHKNLDRNLILPMGKPFTHETMLVRADLPLVYDDHDYLSWLNVINTIYSMFGVAVEHHKSFTRTGPRAKLLPGLLI